MTTAAQRFSYLEARVTALENAGYTENNTSDDSNLQTSQVQGFQARDDAVSARLTALGY